MNSNFYLPDSTPDSLLQVASKSGQMQEFVQSLPLGRPVAAAQALHDQFHALNRSGIAGRKLAPLFLPLYEVCHQLLPAQLFCGKRPADASIQATTTALCQEAFYASLQLYVSLPRGGFLRGGKAKEQKQAWQACATTAQWTLLAFSQDYQSPPAWYWQNLWQLFTLADAEGLTGPDNENWLATMCLFHAADPFHLHPGDHGLLFLVIQRLVHTGLDVFYEGDIEATDVRVDLASAQGPGTQLNDWSRAFRLTQNAEAEQLQQHIALRDGDFTPGQLRRVCKVVNERLLQRPQRKSERLRKVSRLTLFTGMNTVRDVLEHQHKTQPLTDALMTKASCWTSEDIGQGGIRLHKAPGGTPPPANGQLAAVVALSDHAEVKNGRLAIVRWHYQDGERHWAGLEFLHGQAQLLRLKKESPEAIHEETTVSWEPAIYLQPVQSRNWPLLITSHGRIDGNSFWPVDRFSARQLHTNNLRIQTPYIDVFGVDPLRFNESQNS